MTLAFLKYNKNNHVVLLPHSSFTNYSHICISLCVLFNFITMFALGRTAFYYGLIKISLEKNNKILLPNYICTSVLVPIVKLNLNYCYYSINNNFEPNFEDIKKISKDRFILKPCASGSSVGIKIFHTSDFNSARSSSILEKLSIDNVNANDYFIEEFKKLVD